MTTDTMTITLTPPSFGATVGILRAVIENGTPEGHAMAWEEITRWAAMLDEVKKAHAKEQAAIGEARAALNVAIDRLSMNNVDGEELPFMHDCEVALAMLEGRAVPEWDGEADTYDEAHGHAAPQLCDDCHQDPATITVERAFIREGEAPTSRLCAHCYGKVEFS